MGCGVVPLHVGDGLVHALSSVRPRKDGGGASAALDGQVMQACKAAAWGCPSLPSLRGLTKPLLSCQVLQKQLRSLNALLACLSPLGLVGV